MRRLPLLLLAAAMLSTGCSALIAQSGIKPETLTEERAHEAFGTPLLYQSDNGGSSLTFRTRRKIADQRGANRLGMGLGYTCGLLEFLYFPTEVYSVTRTALLGRVVVVYYDSRGNVSSVSVDGESVYDLYTGIETKDSIKTESQHTKPIPAP